MRRLPADKAVYNWLFEQSESDIAAAKKIAADTDVATVVSDLNAATPETIELLKKGKEDNNPNDDVAPVTNTTTTVDQFKPTQNEISLMKSIGYPLSDFQSLKNIATGDPTGRKMSIIVSGIPGIVIDGHHRWSSTWSIAGPSGKILAKNIDFPGDSAGEKLAKAQIAIVTHKGSGPVPQAPGAGAADNILGKGGAIEGMIRQFLGQNTETGKPLLGDEYLAQVIPSTEGKMYFGLTGTEQPEQARELIVKKVAANLASLPAPAEGSPERALMPQFDPKVGGPKIDDVAGELQAGGFNLKDPIVESLHRRRLNSLPGIKRRW